MLCSSTSRRRFQWDWESDNLKLMTSDERSLHGNAKCRSNKAHCHFFRENYELNLNNVILFRLLSKHEHFTPNMAWHGIEWTKNWFQTAVDIVYVSILNDSINVTRICCAEKNVYTYMNVSCIFQERCFPFAFACQIAANILPNFFRVNAIQWIIFSSNTFVR